MDQNLLNAFFTNNRGHQRENNYTFLLCGLNGPTRILTYFRENIKNRSLAHIVPQGGLDHTESFVTIAKILVELVII